MSTSQSNNSFGQLSNTGTDGNNISSDGTTTPITNTTYGAADNTSASKYGTLPSTNEDTIFSNEMTLIGTIALTAAMLIARKKAKKQ